MRHLEDILKKCYPSNQKYVKEKLVLAKNQEGETLFNTIIEIIQEHKHIILRLE